VRIKEGAHTPVVLVGNKVDLEDDRVVTTLEGEELAQSWGKDVLFFEASAKSNINIDELFLAIARAVRDSTPKKQTQQQQKGIWAILKRWLVG
jgi:GTPase SAR1 family protein